MIVFILITKSICAQGLADASYSQVRYAGRSEAEFFLNLLLADVIKLSLIGRVYQLRRTNKRGAALAAP
jgi:hypothetical protein